MLVPLIDIFIRIELCNLPGHERSWHVAKVKRTAEVHICKEFVASSRITIRGDRAARQKLANHMIDLVVNNSIGEHFLVLLTISLVYHYVCKGYWIIR